MGLFGTSVECVGTRISWSGGPCRVVVDLPKLVVYLCWVVGDLYQLVGGLCRVVLDLHKLVVYLCGVLGTFISWSRLFGDPYKLIGPLYGYCIPV